MGPVIAIAIVYSLGPRLGEGICFILNGLSFLFVIWALLKIQIKSTARKKAQEAGMKEGFIKCLDFIRENPNVRTVFTLGNHIQFAMHAVHRDDAGFCKAGSG